MSKDYDVGYGKPPKEHRYPKGQSGNPKGRPKKFASRLSVLEAPVTMKVNGKSRELTPFEAAVRKTAQSAIEGRLSAIKRFFGYCDEAELLVDRTRKCRGGVWFLPIDLTEFPDREFTEEQLAAIEEINRKAKEHNEREEPLSERSKIIARVAQERHLVESLGRRLMIIDIIQYKLRHRALVERHEPSHVFFEKLLTRTTPDLNSDVGYLVVPASRPIWFGDLTIEDVDEDDP